MAGIGFELRRIFRKKTMVDTILGCAYATVATIGPTVTFIIMLFGLQYVMRLYHTSEAENLFFISSFTYAFLVAILISSLVNTILSRYVSDKIYEEKVEDISASIFGVLTVGSVCSGLVMLVFCVLMHYYDSMPVSFLVAYYLLGVLATNTYTLMTYISALKEYKKVTASFGVGVLMAIPSFYCCKELIQLPVIFSLYITLGITFFCIDLMLVFFSIKAFGRPGKNCFDFLVYYKKYPLLVLTGFAYMLGFYITNIIYWNLSDMQVRVSIFKTAPSYDVAMFWAVMINLPSMVIFVVKTETGFYEKYKKYISALNTDTYKSIEKYRIELQNILKLQLFFVYEVQLIITILSLSVADILFPYFGIGNNILSMFKVLGMGLYCTLCMYFTMVFLFYFVDYVSAFITTMSFLGIVTIMSFTCSKLGNAYYPLPLLFAGISGWVISFVLLRYRMKKLNGYLFCK